MLTSKFVSDWKLLWSKVEKKKVPKRTPSVYWVCISLGKLVGWFDSKRRGTSRQGAVREG